MEGENDFRREEGVRSPPIMGNAFIEEKVAKVDLSESAIIKERKEKIIRFLKRRYDWISYVILAIIVWIAIKIRTSNVAGLRDITTGGWTLGPDLDPFLFLRWAKYIVENGSLMALDVLRYSPIGFDTREELIFLPNLIAWFHNLASVFGSTSVEQSAALFPAFMFALTVVAFFLFVRKIFLENVGAISANIIALVSSFFLTVLPSLLPRTIAGIPEKESAGFFFLFITFYFFLSSWKSKNKFGKYGLSILAGLSTAGMALVWGGFIYIFIGLGLSTLISFLLGSITKDKFYIYTIWLFSSILVMSQFSTRYSFTVIASSTTTGISVMVFLILLFDILIFKTKLKDIFLGKRFSKIPKPVISAVISVLAIIILASVVFGPGFIFEKVESAFSTLIKPTAGRIGVTVAENRQPYFGEWANSFGPVFKGIPIFFWMFFIGSIYLFYNMVKHFKTKERIYLTSSYGLFLTAIVFSRYSRGHILNGENFASLFLYFGGIVIFLWIFGLYYYRNYYNNPGKLKRIDYNLLFLFVFFFFSIVSARGAVRLIMVLVPPASIIVGYLTVSLISNNVESLKNRKKLFMLPIILIVLVGSLYSGYMFYKISESSARGYVPSIYTRQWQGAMSWVRENTAEDAVFGHWWDYGYWIQSIGERATVLDGGNAIGYWNHLMGRHALTGSDRTKALEFLYAHDTTHFLIDSTDIGKYTAFASIGSNVDYDRRSWISTFHRANEQTFENKNTTSYLYTGGFSLDEDIVYEINGEKMFLPGVNNRPTDQAGNVAGLGALRLDIDSSGRLLQPIGIFVYRNTQQEIPIRYAHYKGQTFDFGSGLEAGIFLVPRLNQQGDQIQLEENGALLYLSRRTVNSQLARLYLFGEEDENFKIAHIEKDLFLKSLEDQGLQIGDFAYYQGLRGPIKIWEIDYPEDITVKDEYLEIKYPQNLVIA